MGVLSILLGIIAFFAFTFAGIVLSNAVVMFISSWASSLTDLATVSNEVLTIGIIGVFGFIGLLIGMGLIMQGLTYNKVAKLGRRRRHRDD